MLIDPPKRLILPSPEATLTNPANRVVPAQDLVLGDPTPAPLYVSLGLLTFYFYLHPDNLQVDCMVYLNTYLVAYTTLSNTTPTNPPYSLDVQEDGDFGQGPISTSVAPPGWISSVNGSISYNNGGGKQYYQGLLYYWTVPSS